MARPIRKNIYERIDDQKNKIKETEKLLAELNEELQALYLERDKQEMELIFKKVKENGLTIDKAIELGNEIGVSIHVQHEDIFNAMHRI